MRRTRRSADQKNSDRDLVPTRIIPFAGLAKWVCRRGLKNPDWLRATAPSGGPVKFGAAFAEVAKAASPASMAALRENRTCAGKCSDLERFTKAGSA